MATFNVKLDKRKGRGKEGRKFPLSLIVVDGRDVLYISLGPSLTEDEYQKVFGRKSLSVATEPLKKACQDKVQKAKMIYSYMGLRPFPEFRKLLSDKDVTDKASLLRGGCSLDELYHAYVDEKLKNNQIGISTRDGYFYSLRRLKCFKDDVDLEHINAEFLTSFEKWFLNIKREVNGKEKSNSAASVGNVLRSLRAVIKYAMRKDLTPSGYKYPFLEYSIKSYRPPKYVLSNSEIQKVIDLEIKEPDLNYARNIWVALYRMNGINYIDLLQFRWNQVSNGYLQFIRTKTKRTRKNNIRPIVIQLSEKISETLEKIGCKESPFILGLLTEGYTETYLNNKCAKEKKKINKKLRVISDKLNLSVTLCISEGRNAYANTLKRANINVLAVAEKMGHASPETVSKWYFDSFDQDTLDAVNEFIL
jgi:integrase